MLARKLYDVKSPQNQLSFYYFTICCFPARILLCGRVLAGHALLVAGRVVAVLP